MNETFKEIVQKRQGSSYESGLVTCEVRRSGKSQM